MNRLIFCSLVFFTSLLFFSLITVAFAEEYVVEMSTENGFEPQGLLVIQQGDSITFTIINMEEHHDIANPWLGGHNHLAEEQPSITHTFNDCGSYTFDSTWFILDEVVTVDVVCPEITIETTFTSETSIPNAEDVEVFNTPLVPEPDIIFEEEIPTCGFTGWTQEGERNVAYRCGVEVASYVINNPSDNVLGNSNSEYNQTLDFRLQILKVLESIFKIIFG